MGFEHTSATGRIVGFLRRACRYGSLSLLPLPFLGLTPLPEPPGDDPRFAFHVDIRITDQDDGGALSGARLTLLDALTLDTLAAGLDADAAGAYATTVQVHLSNISEASYWVDAPYPNPVSAGHERVTIQYALFGLENAPPALELYDLLGRPVDPDGYLPAGVYLYRLRLRDGGLTKAQSVVLARGGG